MTVEIKERGSGSSSSVNPVCSRAAVTTETNAGVTPLHYACSKGRLEVPLEVGFALLYDSSLLGVFEVIVLKSSVA